MSRHSDHGISRSTILATLLVGAALLAATVVDYTEAQVRSITARVRTDFRDIRIAIEAYHIDWQEFPPPWEATSVGPWGTLNEPPFHARVGSVMTTPVAYLSHVPRDPFAMDQPLGTGTWGDAAGEIGRRYSLWNYPYFIAGGLTSNTFQRGQRAAGDWLLISAGPDGDTLNNFTSAYTPYDPTNGTVSVGNIFSSQRDPGGFDYALFLTDL